ncbi:MAG: fatty acid desaturase [Pseudomonadota bacterium]
MNIDCANCSEDELKQLEKAVADRHLNHFPTLPVIWAFTNTACWLALWPLVLAGVMPVWLGFLLATANFMLFYLPSHEAQHSIIARPGEKLRWLNELVGHASSFPMAIPYRVFRETHMEHHKHANHPEFDPDYGTHARTPLAAVWASIQSRQPKPFGKDHPYGVALLRRGREDLLIEALIYKAVYYTVLVALAWMGYAIEAALLWWLPLHIGTTYLHFYLSWAPHNPNLAVGRYKDTRGFRSRFGNILSMGMQYHIVHHLYPRIPLTRTPAAYREMKPILEARGCEVHAL